MARPFKAYVWNDLESGSRSQGDLENLEKWTFAYFSDTNYSRVIEPLAYFEKVGPRYGTKGEKTRFENMKFYLWGLIALGIKSIHTKFQSTDFCGC